MTSAGTLDVVALDVAVCDVWSSVVCCVCRVCLSASRLPPMRIGSVGGVDPQLSTEGRGGSDGACAPEAGARAFTFSGRVVTPMPL